MTPTLSGRVQTRLVLTLAVAVPWTLIAVPVLGLGSLGPALGMVGLMALLGFGWELAYHGVQQLRWDKDWPSIFALLVGLPEASLLWLTLGVVDLRPGSASDFVWLFGTTWLLLWLIQQGPIRVLAPTWRFRGARFVERRLTPIPMTTTQPDILPTRGDEPDLEPALEPEMTPIGLSGLMGLGGTAADSRGGVSHGGLAAGTWAAAAGLPRAAAALTRRLVVGRVSLLAVLRGVGVIGVALLLAAGVGQLAATMLHDRESARPPAAALSPDSGADTDDATPAAQPTTEGHEQHSSASSSEERSPNASRPSEGQQPLEWKVPKDHTARKTWDTETPVAAYAVTVPKLGLQNILGTVGLNPSGTIETPEKLSEAAWYESGASPGQDGPGVLIGAVAQGQRSGVFSEVSQLVAGDSIVITRVDSTSVHYVVDRVQRVRFDEFPTRRVYGLTEKPTLRLIGYEKPSAQASTGHNVIVYASAVQLLEPRQEQ